MNIVTLYGLITGAIFLILIILFKSQIYEWYDGLFKVSEKKAKKGLKRIINDDEEEDEEGWIFKIVDIMADAANALMRPFRRNWIVHLIILFFILSVADISITSVNDQIKNDTTMNASMSSFVESVDVVSGSLDFLKFIFIILIIMGVASLLSGIARRGL